MKTNLKLAVLGLCVLGSTLVEPAPTPDVVDNNDCYEDEFAAFDFEGRFLGCEAYDNVIGFEPRLP